MECIEQLNWLCKQRMEASSHSFTELSKTQFFPGSIVKSSCHITQPRANMQILMNLWKFNQTPRFTFYGS